MTRSIDDRIAALAARQQGLLTRAQLLETGLGSPVIEYRVRTGRLRAVHRGVYQIGPVEAPRAAEMAAVLACGPGAVVSHRSAAVLWGMLPRNPSAPVDVTTPGGGGRRRRGVRAHRSSVLRADEVDMVEAIPVTTPLRTILDLTAVAGARELERALARAEKVGLASRSDLAALAQRCAGRPGVPLLAALLRQPHGPARTRSKGEDWFRALVKRARLPAPEVNGKIAGHEVDFLWRQERVVVELDGFAFHGSRASFEEDRLRDADLAARGFRVIRVTYRQLTREPEAVLVRLAQTLALARSR